MFKRIDYLGSLTLILALGSLLFAMSYKNNEGEPWSSPRVWGLTVAAVVFGAAFLVVEGFWAAEPVMPIKLLRQRNGVFVSIGCFSLSFAVFSLLYMLPMHYESELAMSAYADLMLDLMLRYFAVVKQMTTSRAGAHLVPNSIALSAGSLFAGWVCA